MPDEKRKHKRFKGKEGAFAAFLRPNELINLGNIVDISMGGLCVRYLSTADAGTECAGIKIFGSNGRFIHVDKVECKVVYDVEIPEGSWEQLSTRRCGVQFANLNVRQKTMLQDFIEHFSHEESFSI
ncbi:MAG: PilZ domain-containing protein [Syntrophobacteraceae bacterium]